MHNIVDFIEEPKFKDLIQQLGKANSEEEMNNIISRHNKMLLSAEEKEQYAIAVALGVENYLKVVDEDGMSLMILLVLICSTKVSEKYDMAKS